MLSAGVALSGVYIYLYADKKEKEKLDKGYSNSDYNKVYNMPDPPKLKQSLSVSQTKGLVESYNRKIFKEISKE